MGSRGIFTSEFWAVVGAVILIVLPKLGIVEASDQEAVKDAALAVLTGIYAIVRTVLKAKGSSDG